MKPRKSEKSLVVGLDVGTSKIVAIVGESQPDGSVEVIGLGSHPSTGLRRGVVVDMASTEQAIQRAVEEAELMAGCEIHSVYAGISGSHIRSLNSDGTVAIKDKEVSEGDVERVLDAARAVPVAADQKILHVLPQEYVIDNQDGIRQPIGMAGVRLEAHVHVVTAALSATQNISKCVARCGLTVDELHGEEVDPVRLLDGVDGDDPGVVEGGERLGLPLEALEALRTRGHLGRQHLEGDPSPKLQILGQIDLSHTAFSDQLENSVVRERASDHVRQSQGTGPLADSGLSLLITSASTHQISELPFIGRSCNRCMSA